MKQSSLAARYARALAGVVKDKRAFETAADELDAFTAMFREGRELRDFLLNPSYPLARKQKGLSEVARRVGMKGPQLKLLEILLQKGRMGILPEVALQFRKLEEESLNRVSVELTTARPLDAKMQQEVVASLEKFTGKTVRLTHKVDPGVLGGARARIGSLVYDGTVASRLQKLKQQIIRER
ncbi:MAG TPA: ATP synthase F1 subunit delta [Candidatus Polarisedimenticolia bacterium]|nr:ATP synthase F1 subunit delta [Candidatus Polarisedimenticolia bacterium]